MLSRSNVAATIIVAEIATVLVSLSSLPGGSAFAVEFDAFAEGQTLAWSFSRVDGSCRLEAGLGNFGAARFLGLPGQPLRFEVLGHRDLFAPGPVNLFRVAPPWHGQHPAAEPLGEVPHLAGGGVVMTDPVATQVLMDLYAGFDAHLSRRAWYSPAHVVVKVSSMSLRAEYQNFVDCLRGVLANSWADVERTRIGYDTDVWVLSKPDRELLGRVADYVRADVTVSAVYVDGHTDSSGTPTTNALLAKRRAQTIADYLGSRGIEANKLIVRYHGAGYPVSDNATPAGRAHNRRTTVRIERNWLAEH